MRIRTVNNPLARGKPLLLLPEFCLIRWPADAEVPDPDATYPLGAARVTVSPEQAAAVRRVLLASSALDRCDAAKELPLEILRHLYSYQQVNHLVHVAERLCPEVRHHVKALAALGQPTSLHHLIAVSYGATPAEQLARWNAPVDAWDRRESARRSSRAVHREGKDPSAR